MTFHAGDDVRARDEHGRPVAGVIEVFVAADDGELFAVLSAHRDEPGPTTVTVPVASLEEVL